MSELRLSWLGSPQIEHNGHPVVIRRRKSMALLAYLAVTAVPHSREFLATLLWPDHDAAHGLANLRRALWDLNKTLGKQWLHIEREQVQLQPDQPVQQDVAAFLDLTTQAGASALEQACTLYRGDFLEGFTLRDAPLFDEWQHRQRERLHRRYDRCLQQLSALAVADGALETAVAYTTRWLALDGLNEEAHRQLICLYAHLGRRATAVRQYETCVRGLAAELGMAPEPATQALVTAVKRGNLPPLMPLLPETVQADAIQPAHSRQPFASISALRRLPS